MSLSGLGAAVAAVGLDITRLRHDDGGRSKASNAFPSTRAHPGDSRLFALHANLHGNSDLKSSGNIVDTLACETDVQRRRHA
ncbi:MAG TPA: hypothetical protein VG960_02565 [Caulobacteraceae bacterium]|nr:hypothetical protein [Caulobacteraceae bacterium]